MNYRYKCGNTEILESEGKRKTVIGNGWTVDVIAHIFKGLMSVKA